MNNYKKNYELTNNICYKILTEYNDLGYLLPMDLSVLHFVKNLTNIFFFLMNVRKSVFMDDTLTGGPDPSTRMQLPQGDRAKNIADSITHMRNIAV